MKNKKLKDSQSHLIVNNRTLRTRWW